MPAYLIVFVVLSLSLVLFILEKWRYDLVALLALLTLTLIGIVPASEAFSGFGHPAVVTVAAILVVSAGLANSGLVGRISKLLSRAGERPTAQILALTLVVSVCSAFMNNVGALALLMPVAIRIGVRYNLSPSILLMPLAFGSLLGGMTTLIGTPPNIIIGSYRAQTAELPFGLFDFAPVGLGVAMIGISFIGLVGWRFIPVRLAQSASSLFEIEDYTTELVVPTDSPFDGKAMRDATRNAEAELVVAAIVRGNRKILSPERSTRIREGDHLIVEVAPSALRTMLEATGFELAGRTTLGEQAVESRDVELVEAVVAPRSRLEGKTAEEAELRAVHALNLLGVARHDQRIGKLLKAIRFRAGDVLLIQGRRDGLHEKLSSLGCLPLAERRLDLGRPARLWTALGIFALAVIALVLRLTPAPIAFSVAAVAMVLLRLVSLREAYRAIDWPIVVLLGAMIPVGGALESTGGAELIANRLGGIAGAVPIPLTLALVMVLAMFLSDFMNNAATAVIMAPISVSVAHGLGASPDPFLMAVAIGASCAFLTPIGHQSATLVMGPGGYRFGDYWRLGLPLEMLIVLLGVPLLIWVWPP